MTYDDWDRKMGLPARLADADLTHGQPTMSLERIRQYMSNGEYTAGSCLILAGPTGVGKSYAAAAAFRVLGGVSKRFWYFPALCSALLNGDRRSEALHQATTTPFAVFDDLGVEYLKEGGLIDTFLDEIIWTREAEYRATLITTNLTTEQVQARLPQRITDRLHGDWGHICEVVGESLRGQ